MKQLLNFIKNHFNFFPNKNCLQQQNVYMQFEKNFYLVKENKRYTKIIDFIFKIKNGDILENDYEKHFLSSLTYQNKYKNNEGKELFYTNKFDNRWLLFNIKQATLEGKKQELIYIYFQYDKQLFSEIINLFKESKIDIQYLKSQECLTFPFTSENFLKLLELEKVKNIQLFIDLNGFSIYQRRYNLNK